MKNKELRLKAQEYIEAEKIDKNTYQVEKAFIDGAKMALQQVKNNDLLHNVSDSLPVKCTRLGDDNELEDGWEVSVERAGELITEQSKIIKFLRDFINEYNSNYS